MANTQEISPRATLPGTIYKKNGHWWWKVRLPGQDRIRCRSLRAPGSRVGTKSRKQAGQIALQLWEEALRAQAREELKKRSDASSCGPSSPPASKHHAPATATETSDIENKKDKSPHGQPATLPPEEHPVRAISNHTALPSDWFDSLIAEDDHALCECCGGQDFFEEYLQQIDSGQRLCPRCYGEFKQKAQAAEKLQCV